MNIVSRDNKSRTSKAKLNRIIQIVQMNDLFQSPALCSNAGTFLLLHFCSLFVYINC